MEDLYLLTIAIFVLGFICGAAVATFIFCMLLAAREADEFAQKIFPEPIIPKTKEREDSPEKLPSPAGI